MNCPLIKLESSKWWCPDCGPEKKRLLPVEARRNCRASERLITGGPGTELHELLNRIAGETPTVTCGCKDRIAKMDRWGPSGCREHLDEIADWLLKEAEERGWKSARWFGSRLAVKTLVRWAIRQSEREGAIKSD